MGAPKLPEQKSAMPQTSIEPLQARVASTQPLPRQVFGAPQQSLGSALIGQSMQGRYDPKLAMQLLNRGGV